jgi:hypothetical protein
MKQEQEGSQEPIDKHHTLLIVDWCCYCPDNLFVVERQRAPKKQEAETPVHACAPNLPETLAEKGGAGQ